MPLKLNVGLAKKVGLPDYGSLGASCNVELELDAHLLSRDGQLFQQQVRQAFAACAQAVQDELARQSAATPTLAASHYPNGNGRANGHTATASNGQNGNGSSRNGRGKSNGRKATSAQVRAICAIAGRQRLNLAHELQSRFQVDRPDDLSVGDASRFIDELQAAAAGTGGG